MVKFQAFTRVSTSIHDYVEYIPLVVACKSFWHGDKILKFSGFSYYSEVTLSRKNWNKPQRHVTQSTNWPTTNRWEDQKGYAFFMAMILWDSLKQRERDVSPGPVLEDGEITLRQLINSEANEIYGFLHNRSSVKTGTPIVIELSSVYCTIIIIIQYAHIKSHHWKY